MLTRLERGAYVVTRKNKKQEEISCLLVNGNGRDLSFLKDDSMDAIITDYFYELPRNLIADSFAAETAVEYGRNSISIEINPKHFEEGKIRIWHVKDNRKR